ncbi:MAG: CBS domain-containing protein [Simplicispira sp.]|nr:CBS domain-containing protein [Simplicispira sp.]
MDTLRVASLSATTRSRLATISRQALLLEAAQRLSETHIGLVVVCEPGGAMSGVIGKSDIVRQIGHCAGSACHTLASNLMTKDVIYCQPTDLLSDVLDLMQKRGLVHVPVLDPEGRPVGVVNARDALRAMVAEGQYEQALLFDYVMGVGYH